VHHRINDTASKFATGVNDTASKFAASIKDIGGNFATGVNDTGSFASLVDTGGKIFIFDGSLQGWSA
jgi:hypothetical protein